jgi:hypothetical protein
MIHDFRMRVSNDVRGGGDQNGPQFTSEFSRSEQQMNSFCYMASESAAGQITDLRAVPHSIEKPE